MRRQPLPQTLAEIKLEHERSQNRIYAASLRLIEIKARKLLTAHKNLDEFVMCMGCWLFTRKDGSDIPDYISRDHIPNYVASFARMMDAFDRMELKVTGEPMRFTATGPKVTAWGATDLMDGKAVAERYGKHNH